MPQNHEPCEYYVDLWREMSVYGPCLSLAEVLDSIAMAHGRAQKRKGAILDVFLRPGN